MDVRVKRTTELTAADIDSINALFFDVFKKERSADYFLSEYLNTPLGHSYHAMLWEGEELVGFHSGVPFYYKDGDKRFIAGLGIDTMTAVGHRDFFNVRDLFKACEETMKADGCVLRIGFPNDNSYPILKKGFKYKDIGKLNTYFLPIKIGAIKPKYRMLNIFSRLLSWCIILFSHLSCSKKIYGFRYAKCRESFDAVRYKWFGGDYQTIECRGSIVRYKVMDYNGVMTAFVLDVYPMSKRAFDSAVRRIYKAEGSRIDMVMYVGYLPFTPCSLITMPHKLEPKHFNFTCKPLVKDLFDDSIYDISHWDVNLSNYDLL